jgi:hypothetical protein
MPACTAYPFVLWDFISRWAFTVVVMYALLWALLNLIDGIEDGHKSSSKEYDPVP